MLGRGNQLMYKVQLRLLSCNENFFKRFPKLYLDLCVRRSCFYRPMCIVGIHIICNIVYPTTFLVVYQTFKATTYILLKRAMEVAAPVLSPRYHHSSEESPPPLINGGIFKLFKSGLLTIFSILCLIYLANIILLY